jgi:hypothetical protein
MVAGENIYLDAPCSQSLRHLKDVNIHSTGVFAPCLAQGASVDCDYRYLHYFNIATSNEWQSQQILRG